MHPILSKAALAAAACAAGTVFSISIASAQDACKSRGDLDPQYCDETATWLPTRRKTRRS